jgi:hypothetical protein
MPLCSVVSLLLINTFVFVINEHHDKTHKTVKDTYVKYVYSKLEYIFILLCVNHVNFHEHTKMKSLYVCVLKFHPSRDIVTLLQSLYMKDNALFAA